MKQSTLTKRQREVLLHMADHPDISRTARWLCTTDKLMRSLHDQGLVSYDASRYVESRDHWRITSKGLDTVRGTAS